MNEETYDGATTALQRWSKRWKALAKKLRWQLKDADASRTRLHAQLDSEVPRRMAAETALASARAALSEFYSEEHINKLLTSHPVPVAAPCAGCAEYQILVENLKFRLKMAEDSNPNNVLSKHNAMLMAVDNADEYKRNWDACHRQHEQCMKLLEICEQQRLPVDVGELVRTMLSKGELPEGWDK